MTHSTEDREDSELERTVTLRYPSWYPINNNTTNLGGIYTQESFNPRQYKNIGKAAIHGPAHSQPRVSERPTQRAK